MIYVYFSFITQFLMFKISREVGTADFNLNLVCEVERICFVM